MASMVNVANDGKRRLIMESKTKKNVNVMFIVVMHLASR